METQEEKRSRGCPLCSEPVAFDDFVRGNSGRKVYRCRQCQLLFRLPGDFPTRGAEKERYLEHRNTREDSGYVRFLLGPFQRVASMVESPVLDYGCGYNPVFCDLLQERGFQADGYDPLFFPGGIRQELYPTIFCIETAEHFHHPHREFERMVHLLATGGLLVVMTDMWEDLSAFPNWYYQNDPTHVVFYHRETMHWLAAHFPLQLLDSDDRRITVYRKQG